MTLLIVQVTSTSTEFLLKLLKPRYLLCNDYYYGTFFELHVETDGENFVHNSNSSIKRCRLSNNRLSALVLFDFKDFDVLLNFVQNRSDIVYSKHNQWRSKRWFGYEFSRFPAQLFFSSTDCYFITHRLLSTTLNNYWAKFKNFNWLIQLLAEVFEFLWGVSCEENHLLAESNLKWSWVVVAGVVHKTVVR